MAVSKTQHGRYATLEGTLSEVVGALQAQRVPKECVVSVYNDGVNTVAVYRK
jgi:hypothetical protein